MNAILKYPGGKWRTAEWITSFFPKHTVYLEPFCGSSAVFFKKHPTPYETINDIDGRIYNFFMVCRDKPTELAALLDLTPFARRDFDEVQENAAGEDMHLTGNDVEDARRFAIRCNQGFGSKLACRVGWKNTKSSSGPINARVWSQLPESVLAVAERLKRAQIENRPANELIKKYNSHNCLIYADPPYLMETRRGAIYSHEMGDRAEHIEMLGLLTQHKGPVILSGYDNDLYNTALSGWHTETMSDRANSGELRIEKLWMNFEYQMRLI